jgi:uncharacterized membrane protein
LYYYLLATWIHLFGDNYVIGRSLSLFMGFLSVVAAYLTGRELKGALLGFAFALLITLDPMAVRLNTLVLHGSTIELLTLVSIWLLVKYIKKKETKFAYLSIAAASIGSAAKFTIIPYLVALYIFILFNQSSMLRPYLLRVSRRFLSLEQTQVIVITYLLWTGMMIVIGLLLPTPFVRIFTIVPGFHGIDKLGQVYTATFFLLFWLIMNIYLFQISYVNEIPTFLRELLASLKQALVLLIVVLVSKAIIEVPLGMMMSKEYIYQTYLNQSSRGFPFTGIFQFLHSVLTTLQSNKLDSAIYLLPTFLLVAGWLTLRQFDETLDTSEELVSFLFLNILLYFVIVPMIHNVRMIYPVFILAYLLVLYSLTPLNWTLERKKTGVVILVIVMLLLANMGVVINYPSGKLSISPTPHIKKFRDDMGEYIHSNNLTGTYLSINPMDAYYLHLNVVPYLIDTFGLGYLAGRDLVNLTIRYTPDYVIFDTWMFAIMKMSPVLLRVYQSLFNYTVNKGTLLFAESDKQGDIVELFRLENKTSKLTISIMNSAIQIYAEGNNVLTFVPLNNITRVKLVHASKGIYSLTLVSVNTTYSGTIHIKGRSVILKAPDMDWEIKSKGIPIENGRPLFNTNTTAFTLYLPNITLTVIGNSTIKNGSIQIHDGCSVVMNSPSS